jgi:hypothetical protein
VNNLDNHPGAAAAVAARPAVQILDFMGGDD